MADEEKAIIVGAKNDAAKALPAVAKKAATFSKKTAGILRNHLGDTLDGDLNIKGEFDAINPENLGKDSLTRSTAGGIDRKVQFYQFSDDELKEAGITADGVHKLEFGGTDPVDVVSGQLVSSTVDVLRLAVLPLLVERAYASGYGHGALFGPGWASTLDIRLLIDDEGVRLLGDAAETLNYGSPAGLALGLPAYPLFGARRALTVDGEHYRVEDALAGTTWLFARNAEGTTRPLTEIRDRHGNTIRFRRDEAGLPLELVHSAGFGVTVELAATDAGPRVAGLSLRPAEDSAPILLVSYGYDERGRLVAITEPDSASYLYEWDEHDRISGWVDRNGHEYHYEYDDEGRVVRTSGAGGYLGSTLAYDSEQRATTVTDGLGHRAVYHYDAHQHVTKIVDPLGGETLIERDQFGRVLSSTDPAGNIARTELDGEGLPVLIVTPDGAETTVEYDQQHRPLRIREANGGVWQYTYDAAGNLVAKADPLGAVTRFAYDACGAISAVTDPLGATTRFALDAAGLQIGATDPHGAQWRTERDEFGREVAWTDPLGATRRRHLTIRGLMDWSEDAVGGVVRYRHDDAGNLVERVDEAGAVTRHEYGPMDLCTATVTCTGAQYSFSYDSELRLTGVTGPTGLTWTYQYDANGRVVAERDFDGRELTRGYDAAGRMTELINAVGERSVFEYDASGRLSRRTTGDVEQRFAYDVMGQMVRAESQGCVLEITRDLLGRQIVQSVDGRTLTTEFDARGDVVSRITPSGAVSRWDYDAVGNPLTLAVLGGGISFGYDAAGRETGRALGSGDVLLQRIYDAAGRMTSLSMSASAEVRQERGYAYRADGAVERVRDRLRGEVGYTLDPLGRATAVTAEGWSEAYRYDVLGNVETVGDAGNAERPGSEGNDDERYTYDALGRVIAKRVARAGGQVIQWSYTWDALDRLVRAETPDSGIWAYSYDPLGRRTAKFALDADGNALEETVFTYDGPRLAEQTRYEPGSGYQTTTTWEYEPGSFLPATQSVRRAPVAADLSDADVQELFRAVVADLVGTPLELVGADGSVTALRRGPLWSAADPREEAAAELDADQDSDPLRDGCPLRFPGQYFDVETGLHYNLNRYYDPETAAYLSLDPLGLQAGPNPRAYTGNPLTESDPLGLNGEAIPKPNLSNAKRVTYGQHPMTKLAITARRNFDKGLSSEKNVAVYLYKDDAGKLRAFAIQSDVTHSERLGVSAVLDRIGVPPEKLDSLYTELQPCGKAYHNCDKWASENLPGVDTTFSFDYGDAIAGVQKSTRAKGMKDLGTALSQLRAGTLPIS